MIYYVWYCNIQYDYNLTEKFVISREYIKKKMAKVKKKSRTKLINASVLLVKYEKLSLFLDRGKMKKYYRGNRKYIIFSE